MRDFLEAVLTRSTREGGCGMSTRPGYYSGRGAITSDLDSRRLERIHKAILENEGEKAAGDFVRMVAAIPVMSATDFLIALIRFDALDFRFDGKVESKGVYAGSEGEAVGTLMSVLGGMMDRDETDVIRGPFLSAHGHRIQGDLYDMSPDNNGGIHIRRRVSKSLPLNARPDLPRSPRSPTWWDRIKND